MDMDDRTKDLMVFPMPDGIYGDGDVPEIDQIPYEGGSNAANMYDTKPCDIRGTIEVRDDRERRDGPGGN